MKVLVVGSGGREHALCEKISQSTLVKKVFVAPGNPGMPYEKIDIKTTDIEALVDFALAEKIDLTIVGPEVSLECGIVDAFEEKKLFIVGPSKKAALLETSKTFAKKIMIEAGVPTADYCEFFDSAKAIEFIEKKKLEKMVVKCDGLAAGKGVIVCSDKSQAKKAVIFLMREKMLGENVEHIIIEDFLEGPEVSVFALSDGNTFKMLGTACDHKRLLDGDCGPNTGGMGVYSPAPFVDKSELKWIEENIFAPMISTMKKMNHPFRGILFAGLMKTQKGFKVLEFNVRFGDPETQVLLPLIENDLVPFFMSTASRNLHECPEVLLKKKIGVHVVLASGGYPENPKTGEDIIIQNSFEANDETRLYFAGVKKAGDVYKTSGGRVLGVTALRESMKEAREAVYKNVSMISFNGAQFRRDIGAKGE